MVTTVIIAITAFVVGGLATWIVVRFLRKGSYDKMMKDAKAEAEVLKKNKLIEVKEKYLALKEEYEKQVNQRNQKMQQAESKLQQREMQQKQMQAELGRKNQELETVKASLNNQLEVVDKKSKELDRLQHLQQEQLEQISGLSAEQAKEKLIEALKDELRIGVMEADIDSDVDARTIDGTGVRAIQLHTGGMCHLDADMTKQGLEAFGTEDLDLVVLENVGNLVCPAEFDTGAVKNAMILSVPEGHDKPLKYPLIFTVCDVLLINKIDVLPYFDFDMEKVTAYAKMRNPNIQIIPICAKTGEGIDAWADWLRQQVRDWQS